MASLAGKVAIVTGGARGIGEGITRCLAEDGANVALVDLDGGQAEATAKSIGPQAIAIRADAAEEEDIAGAVQQVVKRFGGLDIIVNNAGAGRGDEQPTAGQAVAYGSAMMAIDQASWDAQLAQNLRTAFLGSKAAIPHLKARGAGSIVNISSIAGLSASPTLPAYAAAKAGVISLTKSMALELAPFGIRVNAICPGLLWTRAWLGLATNMKMTIPQYADAEPRDVFLEVVKRSVPLGREQTPEDIGRLTAFLCSDFACNITGQFISVDGGITLR